MLFNMQVVLKTYRFNQWKIASKKLLYGSIVPSQVRAHSQSFLLETGRFPAGKHIFPDIVWETLSHNLSGWVGKPAKVHCWIKIIICLTSLSFSFEDEIQNDRILQNRWQVYFPGSLDVEEDLGFMSDLFILCVSFLLSYNFILIFHPQRYPQVHLVFRNTEFFKITNVFWCLNF